MKQLLLKRGKRVTDSPQAVIYLFSRLRWNNHIPCVQCKRDTAYFESMRGAYAANFFIAPCLFPCSFRRVLARQK